jgi:hypothetical protein
MQLHSFDQQFPFSGKKEIVALLINEALSLNVDIDLYICCLLFNGCNAANSL